MFRTKSRLVLLCLTSLLALLAAVLPAPVAAEAQLKAIDGVAELREVKHQLDIDFGASFVAVHERFTIANEGVAPSEAQYVFSLPGNAAVTELSVQSKGSDTRFAIVDADGAIAPLRAPPDGATADMGIVRMLSSEGSQAHHRKRYEWRAFPIEAKHTAVVEMRWTAPLESVGGRVQVRIPFRGQQEALARTDVNLRLTTSFTEVYGGTKLLASAANQSRGRRGQQHRFVAPIDGDLVIEGKAGGSGKKVRAQAALHALDKDSGVLAVHLRMPMASTRPKPKIRRAILVIDVSGSMGEAGQKAAADLVDGLLAELGDSVEIEAVLYNRKARRVFGDLAAADKSRRLKLLQALRNAPRKPGSNLGEALELAGAVAVEGNREDYSDVLMAVVSDGMLPTTLGGRGLRESITIDTAQWLAAVLVPPAAPLPDLRSSPFSEFVYDADGRILSLRYSEAGQTTLLEALQQPAPVDALEVELDRGEWLGADLSERLTPGVSVSAFGFYNGQRPRSVRVRGMQAGKRVEWKASLLPGREAKHLAIAALASAQPCDLPVTEADGKRRLRLAAEKLGVVTVASSGVALDKKDAFASARLAMAQRWGVYHRVVPKPEEDAGTLFEAFRVDYGSGESRLPTGELDAQILGRLLRAHVVPKASGCYKKLRKKDRSAGGTLTLHLEAARGEVHWAEIPSGSSQLSPLRACILDAAYSLPIPNVQQGNSAEHISVVRFPMHFRAGNVEKSTGRKPGDNPLEGLPTGP